MRHKDLNNLLSEYHSEFRVNDPPTYREICVEQAENNAVSSFLVWAGKKGYQLVKVQS